jgi:hypothetical protein
MISARTELIFQPTSDYRTVDLIKRSLAEELALDDEAQISDPPLRPEYVIIADDGCIDMSGGAVLERFRRGGLAKIELQQHECLPN